MRFQPNSDEVAMCGIVGLVGNAPVNQTLYDALLLLQHRGQDAAGIATSQNGRFHVHKARGLVRDVFRTRDMRALPGNMGIGHTRYPTSGSSSSDEEAQPFYVNAPYGITLVHNGNLTNAQALREQFRSVDRRHINTGSDSELLLNVLASELQVATADADVRAETLFAAVTGVHRRVAGAYAVVASVAGRGVLAFRDPFGIRPLCFGRRKSDSGTDWMVASESAALEGCGFELVRDLEPGEAIFIDAEGRFSSQQSATPTRHVPCVFEYVYFARPDSVINGVSVYAARLRMGEYLADRVAEQLPLADIDVVMPVPDSSRPAAMQLALRLNLSYREGLVKNRYVGRTFIMPDQVMRKKSVRQKLSPIGMEFKGKSVLLVDDSIVRGTTSREIIEMARAAGARRVYLASAAPPVRFPNVYGIDMSSRTELVAHGLDTDEISARLGADGLVYQRAEDMVRIIGDLNPALREVESSCFDGRYVTGDVSESYLSDLAGSRPRC